MRWKYGLIAMLAAVLPGAPGAAQIQGRLAPEQIRSESFAGSRIGISRVRNVTVYLPPGYAEQGRRFPVQYFLNHFFEDHREPFAETRKVGIGEIRAHLVPYIRAGAGVTFDSVRVWNVGFEDHGEHVLEYSKFRVEWSTSGRSGVVKGGGLRPWKRMSDGTLKLHRQIGTHDHVG